MCFLIGVITLIVKPCVVIVLDIIYKQALGSSALDLDFTLQWLCHDFTSSPAFKYIFSEVVIAVSVRLCTVIILDILFKHTL